MRNRFIPILLASWLVLVCGFSQSLGRDCLTARNERAALPPNLIASSSVRKVLEKVWKRSPTFREQCRRIAEARWLRIKCSFVPKPPNQSGYRALTKIGKEVDGMTMATVQIFSVGHGVQMIGHEFEHVLEQIEGLDLKALAGSNGVHSAEPGFYETERAVRAGWKVFAEYLSAKTACKPEREQSAGLR